IPTAAYNPLQCRSSLKSPRGILHELRSPLDLCLPSVLKHPLLKEGPSAANKRMERYLSLAAEWGGRGNTINHHPRPRRVFGSVTILFGAAGPSFKKEGLTLRQNPPLEDSTRFHETQRPVGPDIVAYDFHLGNPPAIFGFRPDVLSGSRRFQCPG